MRNFQSWNKKTKRWTRFKKLKSGKCKIVGNKKSKYSGVPVKKGK